MFVSKMRWAAVAVLSLGLVGLVTALAGPRPTPVAKVMQKEDAAPKNEAGPKKEADLVQEALDRARVRRQMARIAAALEGYHNAFGYYPPPAVLDDKGKPTLSWRVAILPFLGESELFEKFKLDEAWDSDHNKKLLARIPDPFLPAGKSPRPGVTYFQYIVGPEAVFTSYEMGNAGKGVTSLAGPGMGMPGMMGGGDGMAGGPGMPGGGIGGGPPGMGGPGGGFGGGPGGLPGGFGGKGGVKGGKGKGGPLRDVPNRRSNISDGDIHTLLFVEAGVPLEWTKPEDVAYDAKKALPRLGGQFRDHIHVATARPTLLTLPRGLNEKILRAAITPAGGEKVILHQHAGVPGNEIRQREVERLQKRNAELKEDAAVLSDTLNELKQEVEGLRWRVEREKILKSDPATAKLQKENDKLEQAMKEARDELKAMLSEVARLKKELNK